MAPAPVRPRRTSQGGNPASEAADSLKHAATFSSLISALPRTRPARLSGLFAGLADSEAWSQYRRDRMAVGGER